MVGFLLLGYAMKVMHDITGRLGKQPCDNAKKMAVHKNVRPVNSLGGDVSNNLNVRHKTITTPAIIEFL
jgi:hypothetical protein|tara:strand:+ start:1350 stop:1556 length:207 start_codon:yes stop_codon:yes gene_type:complete